MAVSKRTRFEVLRRDENRCRYCHSTDTPLTVDHVVPVALGGSDDPSNLVAACKDCNAGKSSSAPDQSVVSDVFEDAIRWARARKIAAERARVIREEAVLRRAPFIGAWHVWDDEELFLPNDWRDSVDRWLDAGIEIERLIEALQITMAKRHVRHDEVFRYISGIIRNWLRELDVLTATVMAEEDA